MAKFIPLPRGYANPVFKDYSVRPYQNEETRLFDLYQKSPIHSRLPDSIIELHDLQLFVIETMYYMTKPQATNDVCAIIHQAFEYYLNRMDPTDASNLRLKSAALLSSNDISTIYNEMEIAKTNIATLININLAVIRTFLVKQS